MRTKKRVAGLVAVVALVCFAACAGRVRSETDSGLRPGDVDRVGKGLRELVQTFLANIPEDLRTAFPYTILQLKAGKGCDNEFGVFIIEELDFILSGEISDFGIDCAWPDYDPSSSQDSEATRVEVGYQIYVVIEQFERDFRIRLKCRDVPKDMPVAGFQGEVRIASSASIQNAFAQPLEGSADRPFENVEKAAIAVEKRLCAGHRTVSRSWDVDADRITSQTKFIIADLAPAEGTPRYDDFETEWILTLSNQVRCLEQVPIDERMKELSQYVESTWIGGTIKPEDLRPLGPKEPGAVIIQGIYLHPGGDEATVTVIFDAMWCPRRGEGSPPRLSNPHKSRVSLKSPRSFDARVTYVATDSTWALDVKAVRHCYFVVEATIDHSSDQKLCWRLFPTKQNSFEEFALGQGEIRRIIIDWPFRDHTLFVWKSVSPPDITDTDLCNPPTKSCECPESGLRWELTPTPEPKGMNCD